MRTPYKLAALLIVALIFSAGECAASCAFASCNPADVADNMPACHHHGQHQSHQSSAPCGHELQLLGALGSSTSHDSVSTLFSATATIPAVIESRPDLIAEAAYVAIPSPPKLRTACVLVLRI
jgi:hypothetical protein